MYILDATTRSLRLSISGSIATQLPFVTSYVLIGQNTFIPGTNHGSSSNANFVTFLQSPTAGTQSQLKFFSLYNPNATSCSALIHYIDNTTTRSIYKTIIYPYETLFYTDGAGWYNNSKNDISQHINHNVLYNLQGGQGDNRYHLGASSDGSRYSSSLPFLQISSDEVKSDSSSFVSGFTGQGYSITKSNNKYTAQFDNLRIRGSMDVYQMIINQIRATNGSLWISDASKATSASYSSATNALILSFQTGSLVPFIAGDILRSKRWGLSGSTTQSQWDITTTVSAVNYATGYVTMSAPLANNSYTVTGSANGTWTQLAERLSNSGSQWVRVGNTGSNSDRRGSLYITSTDIGGPFLDVYDLVTNSVQATGGNSSGVSGSKTKVRLGKLNGIVDSRFGGSLSGYGLYADNVYLLGTISATAGTFSGKVTANQGQIGGWTINPTNISTSGIIINSYIDPYIGIGTSNPSSNGIWIGQAITGKYVFQAYKDSTHYIQWDGDAFGIRSDNFTLSKAGNISASNVILGGYIEANTGYIGGSSGWTITSTKITTSGMQLLGGTTPAIKIGNASAFNTGTGIFMSGSSNTSYLRVGQITGAGKKYLLWDGTNLSWQTPNFTMSTAGTMSITGSVNATSGNFAGTITANTGSIGGWNINSGGISSVHSYGTVSITKSGKSNLTLTDAYGNFTYSAANSNLYSTSVNKYLVDSVSTVTDFNRYESGITISQANPNQGFGVQINHLFGDIVPLFVFTVSGLTINKEYILQSRLQNLTVQGFGTTPKLADHSSIYCWITEEPDPWAWEGTVFWVDNPLWHKGSAESNNLVKQYRMTPTSETTYLWVGGTIAPMDLNLTKVAKFTFSGFRIDSFKQYTELSQKGLLVFNSPENYLQLSSENNYLTNSSKGSLGLLNVAELHVNGTSINDRINNPISVFNGGTGTNSFAHRQFLWYDTQSGMITASGFSSSSGGGSGMSDYNGVVLTGANVISEINIATGVMSTASRALTAADISAAKSSTTVTGIGLLGGGGNLTTDRTITHIIDNGAYHLPANGSAGQLIMRSGTAGSGSWTSDIQTNGTASFASITASAGFTSSTGNIAVGGSITSSQVVKAKYFDANPNYGYQFSSIGAIKVNQFHGTALDLQDFGSLKIGNTNNYGTSSCTFLQGKGNTARGEYIHIQGFDNQASGEIIHIQGYSNSGSGQIIHIEGSENRAEVNNGHTQGSYAIGHIVGSKTFANGSMDGQFPCSTTQVSTIVLYAYQLIDQTLPLINKFYPSGEIDFNRAGLGIDKLHISFFLNVMITYHKSKSLCTYAYQQTFTYNYDGSSTEINTGEPYGDVYATAGIFPGDLGDVKLVQDQAGIIHFLYKPLPNGEFDINSVIVKVEMIEHIAYVVK